MTNYSDLIDGRPHYTSDNGQELPPDPAIPTLVLVTLDNLIVYEGNPRQSRNPAFDEIKESIRSIGLQNSPNVTRADPSHPYMIRDGGNTRLQIMRELWDETGEKRFFEFRCMFHPYTNDMDMLIKHCVENEMRGGMLLIERGLAAIKIKRLLELAQLNVISIASLALELKSRGWTINEVSLGISLYAAGTLLDVIPTALWAGAGRPYIQKMRKTLDNCRTFWLSLDEKKSDLKAAEEEFDVIWKSALSEVDDEELTADEARDAIEEKMAEYLGCPVMTLRGEIQAVSEGVSPGGVIPQSVLTGNIPDLTIKPAAAIQQRGKQPEGALPRNAPKLQEPAKTVNQETASRDTIKEAAAAARESGYGSSPAPRHETIENSAALDDQDDISNGDVDDEDELESAENIRLAIYSTAEDLAQMFGFDHLVVPGEQLSPGTDHFGFLMLSPDDETQSMFEHAASAQQNHAPGAIYRQLVNMSAACKFAFPNSPGLEFFNYFMVRDTPTLRALQLGEDSWLAMMRIVSRESTVMKSIEKIERLACRLIHLHAANQ